MYSCICILNIIYITFNRSTALVTISCPSCLLPHYRVAKQVKLSRVTKIPNLLPNSFTIRCVLSSWKCTKTVFGQGFAPELAGKLKTLFPDPPVAGEGNTPDLFLSLFDTMASRSLLAHPHTTTLRSDLFAYVVGLRNIKPCSGKRRTCHIYIVCFNIFVNVLREVRSALNFS